MPRAYLDPALTGSQYTAEVYERLGTIVDPSAFVQFGGLAVTNLSQDQQNAVRDLWLGGTRMFHRLAPTKDSILGDSPVGHYRLNEGAGNSVNGADNPLAPELAHDASSTQGSASLILGSTNTHSSLTIGTASSNAVLPGTATLDGSSFGFSGNTSHSVEFWFQTPAIGSAAYLVSKRQSNPQAEGWWVTLTTAGLLSYQRANNGVVQAVTSATAATAGNTIHVVATYDSVTSIGTVYINGKVDNALTFTTGASLNDFSGPLRVGGFGVTSVPTGAQFSDVALYNYVLPAGRVYAHYASSLYGFV